MEIVKTMITFSGFDEGYFQLTDTIWLEGHWWLVATYLQNPTTRHRVPERIVLMDGLAIRYQEAVDQPYRFLVNSAIPKSVFDGVPQDGYTVKIHPSALLDTQGPKSIH